MPLPFSLHPTTLFPDSSDEHSAPFHTPVAPRVFFAHLKLYASRLLLYTSLISKSIRMPVVSKFNKANLSLFLKL